MNFNPLFDLSQFTIPVLQGLSGRLLKDDVFEAALKQFRASFDHCLQLLNHPSIARFPEQTAALEAVEKLRADMLSQFREVMTHFQGMQDGLFGGTNQRLLPGFSVDISETLRSISKTAGPLAPLKNPSPLEEAREEIMKSPIVPAQNVTVSTSKTPINKIRKKPRPLETREPHNSWYKDNHIGFSAILEHFSESLSECEDDEL